MPELRIFVSKCSRTPESGTLEEDKKKRGKQILNNYLLFYTNIYKKGSTCIHKRWRDQTGSLKFFRNLIASFKDLNMKSNANSRLT
jgi:hypothetical protein